MADTPEQLPDSEAQNGNGQPKEPDAKELQRQLDVTRAELEAEKKVNQFWQEREKQPRAAAAPAAPAVEEEDELDKLDILKLITEADNPKLAAKQLKSALRASILREGYAKKGDVEQMMLELIGNATAIGTLAQEFPDLANPKTDLFKETQKQLNALEKNPAYSKVPPVELQRIAVTNAELALVRSGKRKTTADGESEEERLERIHDQQGVYNDRTRTPGSGELTADQKRAAKQFGVSEADYKKHLGLTKVGANSARRLGAM